MLTVRPCGMRRHIKLVVGMLIALPFSTGFVSTAGADYSPGPVPRANCANNDPFFLEPALQGEVPLADRTGGRSQLGYRCNLALVGQHQGQGHGWQNAWYDHCDYYDTKTSIDPSKFPNGGGNGQTSPGVQVLDISNPGTPKLTVNLDTPAMDGPWESLKVNQKRGLLAGVGGFGGDVAGPLYFDVYDVKGDCAHPKLLSSTPTDLPNGHEGNWAPDGLTYYGSSLAGTMAAIDVSDPSAPKTIVVFPSVTQPGSLNHGLSLSDDGKTLYATSIGGLEGSAGSNGLEIYDVSAIQSRSAAPVPSHVGSVYWTDGSTAQHTIPIFYGKHPYVVFVDEGGGNAAGTGTTGVPAGASRIIDIANPAQPSVVSVLRLEIQEVANAAANQAEIAGNGSFGYEAHYCSVDREYDPTALACGYFQSGIRVFDIRDPFHPREIAYFNPPAQVAKHGTLNGSEHDGGSTNSQPPNDSTDWCSSQIRFTRAADGSQELWVACQDSGFMVLRFTNGVYPLGSLTNASAVANATTSASPSPVLLPVLPNTSARRHANTFLVGYLLLIVVTLGSVCYRRATITARRRR
ncbi:MAG: LVIVD repeat-containing protein [Candidatus Dormibacteria bacterium]